MLYFSDDPFKTYASGTVLIVLDEKYSNSLAKFLRIRYDTIIILRNGWFSIMDFGKVKSLVVKRLWDENPDKRTADSRPLPKSGDEYRSLSKQIDTFILHLQDEKSPLRMLPIEVMAEDDIAEMICTFLNRSQEDRLIYNQLDYKGLKYNYSCFIGNSPESEKRSKMLREKILELPPYEPFKIKEWLQDTKNRIRTSYRNNYKVVIESVKLEYTAILDHIVYEKDLYHVVGTEFVASFYTGIIVDVIDALVCEFLIAFIIRNKSINDKIAELYKVQNWLERLETEVDSAVNSSTVNREKTLLQEEDRRLQEESATHCSIEHQKGNRPKIYGSYSKFISRYFALYLKQKAYFDEQDQIIALLHDDIQARPETPAVPKLLLRKKIDECSDQELKAALCAGQKIAEYKRKLQEAKKLIEIAIENGNEYLSPQALSDIKPVFEEVFINKVRYRKKQAMSIARDILEGQQPERYHMLFLDMKIQRGYFREFGFLAEYEIFNNICRKMRTILLKTYATFLDRSIYSILQYIGICFFNAFLYEDVCGLSI